MVVRNNYSSRFEPSVHTLRKNVDARMQRNAAWKAYGGGNRVGTSIFPDYQQTTSISYNSGSNAYMKGAVIGQSLNLIGNNWGTIKNVGSAIGNWFSGAFNTVKGWFS